MGLIAVDSSSITLSLSCSAALEGGSSVVAGMTVKDINISSLLSSILLGLLVLKNFLLCLQ